MSDVRITLQRTRIGTRGEHVNLNEGQRVRLNDPSRTREIDGIMGL